MLGQVSFMLDQVLFYACPELSFSDFTDGLSQEIVCKRMKRKGKGEKERLCTFGNEIVQLSLLL